MKNKSWLLVVLLLLVGITSGHVASTYAKYTSEVEASGTATVAKWAFDTENTNKDLEVDLAGTYDATTLVAGKIAPGTQGSFAIELTNANSEVGVDFEIAFEVENVPTNLKFYKDDGFTEELDVANGITGQLVAEDATGVTANVYWKWAYETTDGDLADTTDGKAGNDLTITATITGTQVEPSETSITSHID